MATYVSTRTMTQRVCITLGFIFIAIGLLGIIVPGFMGMHLSMAHNFIHLISGVLALWSGYADESRKAYNFCIGFGALYGILGISGFVFGEPGYPGVGHMEADENLLRIIPNVLEFGGSDHIVHIVLSGVFLITAYAFRQSRAEAGVRKESYQSVKNFTLKDSVQDKDLEEQSHIPLDEGVRHLPNQDRHTDYERRL